MPQSPNSFDTWRRGEPSPTLDGKVSSFGFESWRRGEPGELAAPLPMVAAATAASAVWIVAAALAVCGAVTTPATAASAVWTVPAATASVGGISTPATPASAVWMVPNAIATGGAAPVPVVPPSGGGVSGRYEPPGPWRQAGWIELRGVEAHGQIGRVRVWTEGVAVIRVSGVTAHAEVGTLVAVTGPTITGAGSLARVGLVQGHASAAVILRAVDSRGDVGILWGAAGGLAQSRGIAAELAVGYLQVQTADPLARVQRRLAQEREDEEALQALEVFDP